MRCKLGGFRDGKGEGSGSSNEKQGGHLLHLLAQWYERNYKNNSIATLNSAVLHCPHSFHSRRTGPHCPSTMVTALLPQALYVAPLCLDHSALRQTGLSRAFLRPVCKRNLLTSVFLGHSKSANAPLLIPGPLHIPPLLNFFTWHLSSSDTQYISWVCLLQQAFKF